MITFAEKYYITTAIAYVNGKPHIGHTLEFIQADCIARYQRSLGKEVHFLTGTDEHGQKIVEAAKNENLPVEKLVEKNAQLFIEFTKLLNMSNDDFIRTTDQKKHWPAVIKLWNKLKEKGDIYKKEYEGLYCVGCEKFVTQFELDEEGNCPNHKTPPKKLKEENYFFKLSKYAKEVHDLIEKDEIKVVPKTRKNEILSFLADEVHDISFSRHKSSLTWGIPVPGDPDQVMYVWCDALSNYISGVDYENEGELFQKFWPADVHVIGKDILRFHAAYWPAMHLSAGIKPPKSVFSHGFVNSKGQKMSKSLGNVIDPYEQIEKFGLEQVRFYLLKELPSHDDGDYSEEMLVETINNDLANDLGNLIRRTTVLIEKYFDGNIPKQSSLEKVDEELIKESNIFEEYSQAMEEFELNKAAHVTWGFIRATNKYLSETEPWKIEDRDRLGTVLYNTAEAVRIIAHYITPFIPESADEVLKRIGQERKNLNEVSFQNNTTGTVSKGDILFTKIEEKKMENQEGGSDQKREESEDAFPLNLKVAKVESVEDHPDADKLYVLQLDLGNEKRQLVAGIKQWYAKEELQGKTIVMITNLKYAKLRGVESQGMLLAAEKDEKVQVLETTAAPGTQVGVKGKESSTKKIGFDDFKKVKLEVKGERPYADGELLSAGDIEITAVGVPDGAEIR